MNYALTSPCENCPFRRDVPGYLHPGRVTEIERSLERATFPCHKTTEFDDDGQARATAKTQHCAGALILLEKLERPSQMMRISERCGFYDRRKLKIDAPVFDNFNQMRRHMKR